MLDRNTLPIEQTLLPTLSQTPTSLQNDSEPPTSPISPLSPPPSTSPRSATGSSTGSPASSQLKLTPPPRLHLRTLIPSVPLPKEYLKTAPPSPYPWVWRCHLCNSIYRLGVTRRCLNDGHFFCSLPTPPPPSPAFPTGNRDLYFFSSEAVEKELNEGKRVEDVIGHLRPRGDGNKNKKRKRKAVRGCRSEFDYRGWSRFNVWRREVRVLRDVERRLTRSLARGLREGTGWWVGKEKERGRERIWGERAGVKRGWSWRERNCWEDCDFPSECHNERKAEREWEWQMSETREWEGRWVRENENELDGDGDGDVKEQIERPATALGMRSVDEVEEGGREAKMDVDVAEMANLGPLGTDCDGLGEQIFQLEYTTKRRSSHDAALGSDAQPKSLLKECSFDFEGITTGCQVWENERSCSCKKKEHKGEKDYLTDDDNGDVQMREVSMAKSMLLRSVEKDVTEAEERFGDEDEEVL